MYWLDVKMRIAFLFGASLSLVSWLCFTSNTKSSAGFFSVEPVFYLKYKSLTLGDFWKTLLVLTPSDEYQKPGDQKTKLRKREIAIRI